MAQNKISAQIPHEIVTHTPDEIFRQIPNEIAEKILLKSDVKDLIRFKSVLKSWKSLISDRKFIRSHIDLSNHCDQENAEIGNRRVVLSTDARWKKHRIIYESDGFNFDYREYHLVGSCDGLVSISTSRTDFYVINPETREVNKLKKPRIPDSGLLVYGFGYDSATDDYKVIVGYRKFNKHTYFLKFSLKSNVWEVIGELKYTFVSRVGILYHGALHWVVYHGSPLDTEKFIVSFDLSEDKFKEVAQPEYFTNSGDVAITSTIRLGILDGSLCAFQRERLPRDVWVMKRYNVKESWELVGPECAIKTEIVHRVKDMKTFIPNKRSLSYETWVGESSEFLGASLYVPSLVSPNLFKKPRRKRALETYNKTGRSPFHGLMIPGSSSGVGNLDRSAILNILGGGSKGRKIC